VKINYLSKQRRNWAETNNNSGNLLQWNSSSR